MFDILFKVHYYLNPGTGSLIVQLLAAWCLGRHRYFDQSILGTHQSLFQGRKICAPTTRSG